MVNSKYIKFKTKYESLEKDIVRLLNQIKKIKRKLAREKLWLGAVYDPYRLATDAEQQGPLITEMFEIIDILKEKVK